MRYEPVVADSGLPARLILTMAPLFLVAVLNHVSGFPTNHDVAWLLEATRRWVRGAELYRDIVEINPPLIFLETYVLSFGKMTPFAFNLGVCLAIGISAYWTLRWHDEWVFAAVLVALPLSGMFDFGQRDHLALIFLTPFLLARSVSRGEAVLLGLWAFFGIGLKPHFALIPLAFIAAQSRPMNVRALFKLQNLVLGGLCVAWLAAVWLAWPRYFGEIIPLARSVYAAFGIPINSLQLVLAATIPAIVLLVLVRHLELLPLAVAALAAMFVFLMQGRFWTYHMIPALGLSSLVALLAARNDEGLMRQGLVFIGLALAMIRPLMGPMAYNKSVIPVGVSPVLFLADKVPVAYPMASDCGVFNASRYPTFWTLPGAWNSGNMDLFRREVAKANEDIRRYRPSIIFEVPNPGKFKAPFHFSDWLDVSDYRRAGARGPFIVWLRKDVPASVLDLPNC